MRQRPRIYYTESQKALMWERWKKGDSLQQVGHLFDRNHSWVQGILVQTGNEHLLAEGINPAVTLTSVVEQFIGTVFRGPESLGQTGSARAKGRGNLPQTATKAATNEMRYYVNY